ncbi:hypothetical protein B0H13DRAFT_2309375 [Mycena leptocephala]|nr:hypothetical protein B0H13DRAFT_2309375 [Mycena leptocephala]
MAFSLTRFCSPLVSGTLANGILYRDFAPTRDVSVGRSSSFTYKDCHTEFPPSSTVRGKIATYYPSVFGEIVWLETRPVGFAVKLTCPLGAVGDVKTSYDKQLHILHQVLLTEQAQEGGDIVGSWFGDADAMNPTDRCFMVNVMRNPTDWIVGEDIGVGTILGLWVNLHRSDKEVKGSIQHTYALEADFFIPVTQ